MSYRTVILALTPVAYWRLGETTGSSAADETGNGNTLTYTNATLNQSALAENDAAASVLFAGDATSVALRTGWTTFPTTAISVAMLLHPTDPTQPAIGKTAGLLTYASSGGGNSDFRVFHNVGYSIDITINGTAASFTGSAFRPNAPRARLLVATWRSSDGRAQLWLDGVLLGSVTLKTGYTFGASGAVALAQNQGSVGGTFSAGTAYAGQMQDTVLLNRVLTDNEIADLNVAAKRSAEQPTLTAALSPALNVVRVVFSKPCVYIDPTANYTIPGLTVTVVSPSADRAYVDLTTTGMVQGTTYTVTVSSAIGDGTSALANTALSFVGDAGSFDAPTSTAIEGLTLSTYGASPGETPNLTGLSKEGLITSVGASFVGELFDTGLSKEGLITSVVVSFVGELFDTHSIGSTIGATRYYTMRAYRSLSPGYVRWTVSSQPDFTANYAPFPLSQLTDIIIERRFTAS